MKKTNCSNTCPVDPVELGIKMAALDREMKELRGWSKKNWQYTKKIHRMVKVMSITLRRHRLVFGGIWGFVCLSSILLWELASEWIKIKFKLLLGG